MEQITELYDSFLESNADLEERHKVAAQKAGRGIKTGIHLFNVKADNTKHLWELRIPKEAITLVCALTGGGKTSLLTNLAVRMSMEGAAGIYLTLEEPGYQIRAKMLACFSKTQNLNFSSEQTTVWQATQAIAGKRDCKDMKEFNQKIISRCRIVDANTNFGKNITDPTIIYDPQYLADLIAYLKHKTKRELDYVIIDFTQLMVSSQVDNSNVYIKMKAIVQALKNIAGEGLSVIGGAQMHRSCAKEKIWAWNCESIRDGSDLEQGAALILAQGMDWDYPDSEYQTVIRVMKNRYGPKRCGAHFGIDYEHGYIPLEGLEPKT